MSTATTLFIKELLLPCCTEICWKHRSTNRRGRYYNKYKVNNNTNRKEQHNNAPKTTTLQSLPATTNNNQAPPITVLITIHLHECQLSNTTSEAEETKAGCLSEYSDMMSKL